MSFLRYAALGAFTTAIGGGAASPTLKNLAASARVLGDEIDLTASGDRQTHAIWDLQVRFALAPSAGKVVSLYLIPAIDGTNYADGDASVTPPLTYRVGVFPVRAVTTQQRVALPFPVILPPSKFKPLIQNDADQAFTNTDGENVLSYRTVVLEAAAS